MIQITVVVVCTIAGAKVQLNYNCYNVYFIECLQNNDLTSDFFSGTFHSAEGGTFLSAEGGTFLPILSANNSS